MYTLTFVAIGLSALAGQVLALAAMERQEITFPRPDSRMQSVYWRAAIRSLAVLAVTIFAVYQANR
jgi:hypothetical protein